MKSFSRREFLSFSALLALLLPIKGNAFNVEKNSTSPIYPNTLLTLKQAFESEMVAYKHYVGYVEKALTENYPNIAYMFKAFSISEKIHANNYHRIINDLGDTIATIPFEIKVLDTKSNLLKAAEKEYEKIQKVYPDFLKKVETENCDEAIKNLMYSWKSHHQHEKKVKKILNYTEYFFGSVAKEIEGMALDIFVCEICGSTIDEEPVLPCDICNKSLSHYKRIDRPKK